MLAEIFWTLFGSWLVLVIMFLWAIERRLAELVAVVTETNRPGPAA